LFLGLGVGTVGGGVLRRVPEQLEQPCPHHLAATRKADVAVGLEQHIEPAEQAPVVAAEAGQGGIGVPARAGLPLAPVVAVPEAVEAVAPLHRLGHALEQLPVEVPQLREERLIGVRGVEREVEGVDAPIGGVAVDEEVGPPGLVQGGHAARLGGLLFRAVAVEVPPLARVARAHAPRGVQLPLEVLQVQLAVGGADAVVAIRVEVRNEHQAELVEQLLAERGERQVARECQHGLFALHLAGVDVGLHHHHGLLLLARELGREAAAIAQHERHHGLPFAALSEVHPPGELRAAAQLVGKGDHVGVTGGFRVVRGFGPGEQLGHGGASERSPRAASSVCSAPREEGQGVLQGLWHHPHGGGLEVDLVEGMHDAGPAVREEGPVVLRGGRGERIAIPVRLGGREGLIGPHRGAELRAERGADDLQQRGAGDLVGPGAGRGEDRLGLVMLLAPGDVVGAHGDERIPVRGGGGHAGLFIEGESRQQQALPSHAGEELVHLIRAGRVMGVGARIGVREPGLRQVRSGNRECRQHPLARHGARLGLAPREVEPPRAADVRKDGQVALVQGALEGAHDGLGLVERPEPGRVPVDPGEAGGGGQQDPGIGHHLHVHGREQRRERGRHVGGKALQGELLGEARDRRAGRARDARPVQGMAHRE
ncbi:hypothetical protein STIAU_1461, partial [Stigmatella aurantiaca DW4/3-1]